MLMAAQNLQHTVLSVMKVLLTAQTLPLQPADSWSARIWMYFLPWMHCLGIWCYASDIFLKEHRGIHPQIGQGA